VKPATPTSFRNRTGMQLSPGDVRLLVELDDEVEPIEDGAAVAILRESYIADADALGSIPAPGASRAGRRRAAGEREQVLIDRLGERMAFERTGVRLYQALQAKCDATLALDDPGIPVPPRTQVQRIAAEEAQHYQMVAAAIASLGGDPTAQTPAANLAGIETAGLLQVLSDPRTTLTQSLHAILSAELIDNAGWELLMTLAEACAQGELVRSVETALLQEAEHLRLVQEWHVQATLSEARRPAPG
jgi:rubrerythrin